MALWKPDQTFYPSARMAMQAPREQLGYVVTFNPTPANGKHDALCVLDLDPKSKTYSQVVGRAEVPNAGDELHHFGWNACSAALCPYAPHPHIERRYLLVPGLRSSRIYVFDTKPDPRNPKLVKTIEADEIASRAGYSRPHTVHCGPDAIYVSALGAPKRRRAGRNLPARPRELRRAGAMGSRSRAAAVRLRFLVASRVGRGRHQRMGHAEHDRKRRRARVAARRQIRARDSYLESAQSAASAGARPRRGASDGARVAAVARSDQDVRLRRRRDLDQGFVGVDLAVASRQRATGKSAR